ncbi:MAG: homoserine O-acetyltransferase [Sumerlaeia bacterium]
MTAEPHVSTDQSLPRALNGAPLPPEGSTMRLCRIATEDNPLTLEGGSRIGPVDIAFETYGTLNEEGSNAILVFHAFSGSPHAAGFDPVGPGNGLWTEENHQGWWDDFIGPGKALDTRRYCVICMNFLGGCYGSTGPMSPNPEDPDRKPYGWNFPFMSIGDIVDSQVAVLDLLGVKQLAAILGGSMGGLCVLDFAARYPERVRCVIPIATGFRATVLTKTFNFEQILAIETDPNFKSGNYYDGPRPDFGLMLARMIQHKTFFSLQVIERRAKNTIVQPGDVLSCYELRHQVESYLLHQGRKFVKRFDANSYLRIIAAWQSFDLPKEVAGGNSAETLRRCKGQKWILFSIDSDVCFFPDEQAEIEAALKANGVAHQYITVHSDKGHDSFLLEPHLYAPHINYALSDLMEG